MPSSRFLNPITPGGLLTTIAGLLSASEALVVQSIATGQYFYFNEIPTGAIGGNVTYVVAHIPNPLTSLEVYLNGVKQTYTSDYSITGDTITMVLAPSVGDILTVNYINSPI